MVLWTPYCGKGVSYLISALDALNKGGAAFKAIIMGEGPEQEELEEMVTKYRLQDRVIFAGWVNKEEILDYYHATDVFVGPSLHEALGLVFVEAQAAGLPVVASNVGGIPDTASDGETGFLVQPKDSKAIYKSIHKLYTDKNLNKSMQGVSSRFSWSSVVSQYDQIYEDVLNRKR